MIIRMYHYLYFCYYRMINDKLDHRQDGASGLLSLFLSSIIIAAYYNISILVERETYVPALEGSLIFGVGVTLAVCNWFYFVRKKKYLIAVTDFRDSPKYLALVVGIILIILPFALFVISGIKMGSYIRSIQ